VALAKSGVLDARVVAELEKFQEMEFRVYDQVRMNIERGEVALCIG